MLSDSLQVVKIEVPYCFEIDYEIETSTGATIRQEKNHNVPQIDQDSKTPRNNWEDKIMKLYPEFYQKGSLG